jgi:hypothetical protein
MSKTKDREKLIRLYDALKEISKYQAPEKLHRSAETEYGLEAHEAIEMAYENVIWTAQRAIKGMRRPTND